MLNTKIHTAIAQQVSKSKREEELQNMLKDTEELAQRFSLEAILEEKLIDRVCDMGKTWRRRQMTFWRMADFWKDVLVIQDIQDLLEKQQKNMPSSKGM